MKAILTALVLSMSMITFGCGDTVREPDNPLDPLGTGGTGGSAGVGGMGGDGGTAGGGGTAQAIEMLPPQE